MLWFAYKMYLWCVELQPIPKKEKMDGCCDLLTKCIFDVLSYNCIPFLFLKQMVVICLQNVSLMCWVTTDRQISSAKTMLWFAYKMYLWCVELQLRTEPCDISSRCDLLTKCIFDVLSYNVINYKFLAATVVICLQNVSLMCWVTTSLLGIINFSMLWFAYKMYLWCVELQHFLEMVICAYVVICLQNVSLMCWVTT